MKFPNVFATELFYCFKLTIVEIGKIPQWVTGQWFGTPCTKAYVPPHRSLNAFNWG